MISREHKDKSPTAGTLTEDQLGYFSQSPEMVRAQTSRFLLSSYPSSPKGGARSTIYQRFFRFKCGSKQGSDLAVRPIFVGFNACLRLG
jgi:hypothetical protein